MYKDLPHPPAGYLPWPESKSLSPSSSQGFKYANGTGNGHANGHAEYESAHENGNGHARDATDATYVQYGDYDAETKNKSYGGKSQSVPYAARSADGSDYNILFPQMGAARRPYARTVPPTMSVNRKMLPDASLVFDALLRRQPSPRRVPHSQSNSTSDSIFSSLSNSFMGLSNIAQDLRCHGALPSSSPDAIPGHTILPPTDCDGFARHPGGISSLFFAFADLIIHDCFNTDHVNVSINKASSYLDLSPLYGTGSDKGGYSRDFAS